MKKTFTLIVSLFALCTCWAQETDNTFQFTDFEGNVVTDGSVITVNTLNEEGQMVVPLKVRNISSGKAAVSMYENIDAKPNGQWQTCAFGNCMTLYASGYSPKNIQPADYDQDIQTEWLPEAGNYGTWSAKLQIHVFNIKQVTKFGRTVEEPGDEVVGYGPTVTVNFVYTDPAGINAVAGQAATLQYYTIGGQRLSTLCRGLNIVRMADGRTVKRMKQ